MSKRRKYDDGQITIARINAFLSENEWMASSPLYTNRIAWKSLVWMLEQIQGKKESTWTEKVRA